MFGLSRIEQITQIAELEKENNEAIRKILSEAVRYVPPFVEIIAESLTPAREYIRKAKIGDSNAGNNSVRIEKEIDALTDQQHAQIHGHSNTNYPKDLARIIARSVHPDSKISLGNSYAQVLPKTRKAVEAGDKGEVEYIFLQTTPALLLKRVTTLLEAGFTFDQIAEANPDIVGRIAMMQELAYSRFGVGGKLDTPKFRKGKVIKTTTDALREAEKIKVKETKRARIKALGLIYRRFEEVKDCTDDLRVQAQVDAIQDAMNNAGEVVQKVDNFFVNHGEYLKRDDLQRKVENAIVEITPHIFPLVQAIIQSESTELLTKKVIKAIKDVRSEAIAYKIVVEQQLRSPGNSSPRPERWRQLKHMFSKNR
jgi:DNA-directed RNA polymerase subunit F